MDNGSNTAKWISLFWFIIPTLWQTLQAYVQQPNRIQIGQTVKGAAVHCYQENPNLTDVFTSFDFSESKESKVPESSFFFYKTLLLSVLN